MTRALRKKNSGRNVVKAIAISAILHTAVLIGLVYAASRVSSPILLEQDAPMSVMMIDLAAFSAAAGQQPSELTAPEENLHSEPVPQEIIAESEVATEPEIMPKSEPKPIPDALPVTPIQPEEKKIESVKKDKPKAKKTVAKKPREQIASTNSVSPSDGDKAVTSAPVTAQGDSLTRGTKPLHRAQPLYPNRARAMGIEGQVKVKFDVNTNGLVDNIRIISESPKNMFSNEVKRAMKRWRYEINKPSRDMEITIIFKLTSGAEIS